ncbi:hypothetical protein MKQ70_00580 [Chitinophaga sedimenti]|nr:hypothetical protein [Chitinophaga sedimenti]MCK7553578.1 hypothetical protein [Chitinophaga sedimenti]
MGPRPARSTGIGNGDTQWKKGRCRSANEQSGFRILLARETGKPLFPIEERPVPDTGVLPGEEAWPTQPWPVKPAPFTRHQMTEADFNPFLSDSSLQDVRTRWQSLRKGHIFMPPSREGTLIFPGFDGGAEWGGPAFDPETGILYVNANEMPWVLTMVVKDHAGAKRKQTWPRANACTNRTA